MNFFSHEIDLLGSVPGKCKYVFKESTNTLSVYIAIPTTSSDLSIFLVLPRSFEINLYFALKLSLLM